MAGGKRDRAAPEEYESDDGLVDDAPKSKRSKAAPKKAASAGTDLVFKLGTDTKQVSVGEFHGRTLVNIREYYKDKTTGEMKPGKKGIALTMEVYNGLLAAIPAINKALIAKGEKVGEIGGSGDVMDEDDLTNADDAATRKQNSRDGSNKKSNIEETSDEEE